MCVTRAQSCSKRTFCLARLPAAFALAARASLSSSVLRGSRARDEDDRAVPACGGNTAAVAVELDTAVIEARTLATISSRQGASIEALSSKVIADGLLPLHGALVSPGVIPALAVLIVLCYRFFHAWQSPTVRATVSAPEALARLRAFSLAGQPANPWHAWLSVLSFR
jgi:hypothetical protein